MCSSRWRPTTPARRRWTATSGCRPMPRPGFMCERSWRTWAVSASTPSIPASCRLRPRCCACAAVEPWRHPESPTHVDRRTAACRDLAEGVSARRDPARPRHAGRRLAIARRARHVAVVRRVRGVGADPTGPAAAADLRCAPGAAVHRPCGWRRGGAVRAAGSARLPGPAGALALAAGLRRAAGAGLVHGDGCHRPACDVAGADPGRHGPAADRAGGACGLAGLARTRRFRDGVDDERPDRQRRRRSGPQPVRVALAGGRPRPGHAEQRLLAADRDHADDRAGLRAGAADPRPCTAADPPPDRGRRADRPAEPARF
mmetsp:Transcript_1043/g.2732  ORF Transcript_1043/g.2732 Transcript_1043/m.2732 type:complete len:316 (-) Transcript_1043:1954-2901(-)